MLVIRILQYEDTKWRLLVRDPKYNILFEPVRIGPVQTRNRFYQVPHCSGMGYRYPNAEARMRGVKVKEDGGLFQPKRQKFIHLLTFQQQMKGVFGTILIFPI